MKWVQSVSKQDTASKLEGKGMYWDKVNVTVHNFQIISLICNLLRFLERERERKRWCNQNCVSRSVFKEQTCKSMYTLK